MDKIRKKSRPEKTIQDAVIDKLRLQGWFVKSTHGSIFQAGFPDLYCAHQKYGARWAEVKNYTSFRFTAAQLETFPLMTAAGVGIWVVTSVLEVPDLFFKPPNWFMYLM